MNPSDPGSFSAGSPPPPPPAYGQGYTQSGSGYSGSGPLQRPATLGHAICGPLLLITLGLLLAEDSMGSISFGRTWPVLLIVFGLCKLGDFMGSRAH
jgi:hypothetical protein